MVIYKTNSILVASKWVSALFWPMTWNFPLYYRGARVWPPTYVLVSGSGKESVFQSNIICTDIENRLFWVYHFKKGKQRFCKLQLINLFQINVWFRFSLKMLVFIEIYSENKIIDILLSPDKWFMIMRLQCTRISIWENKCTLNRI